jgi:D-alanyl-D-alanine carboxypeptidase
MHRASITLLTAGLLFISATAYKPGTGTDTVLKENLQKILDRHLEVYKKKFSGKTIGFGLYVKLQGKNTPQATYQNNYVSSGFPVSYGDNIQFGAASSTKSFTAAGILKLHQQGKLNIDDLITANIPGTNQPYIPNTSGYAIPNKNRITIRLLLQHRAGVFDVTNDEIPDTTNAPYAGKRYTDFIKAQKGDSHTFTFAELTNVIAQYHLSYFEPNTNFHYSNSGYHLLAVIIERISGKRYSSFIQEQFLTPLKMYHTYLPYLGTDQEMPQPHITGWLKYKGDIIQVDKDNISSAVADGNARTTPADLATWANALYGTNTILNAKIHAQMIAGIPTHEVHVNYGLGTEKNPADIGYGHNGARPPYITTMRYHPKSNATYVLFSNFFDYDNFLDQGEDMADIVREAIQAVEATK